MGEKIDSYIDEGNTVRDGDEVVYLGKFYRVIYISDNYVNLMDNKNRGLHISGLGKPLRVTPNFTESVYKTVTKKSLFLALTERFVLMMINRLLFRVLAQLRICEKPQIP